MYSTLHRCACLARCQTQARHNAE